MRNLRRLFVFGATASAVVVLVCARPHPNGSPAVWSGSEVAGIAAWVMATGVLSWLTIVSAACTFGERSRIARTAPAFVRRLLGITIAGTVVIGPALPAVATPKPTVAVVARDEPVVRTVEQAAPAPTPARRRTGPRTHVVRRGENLWVIARDELAARGFDRPDGSTVARYWRAVVAANDGTLRSGNPSLIFAGEIVALPEPG